MKKKAIEKIPYVKLPKMSKKNKFEFIGTVEIHEISNENHIILDIYNKRDLKKPVIRYAASNKEYGTFNTETEIWYSQKLNSSTSVDTNNISLVSKEDEDLIKNFFKNIESNVWCKSMWQNWFEANEKQICNSKISKTYENRKLRLEQREKDTPELREKEILDWADGALFHNKHYLYYKKKGRYATVACTKCGGVASGAWKTGEAYESQFERAIVEPRDKHIGFCPLCGCSAQYAPQGRMKSQYAISSYVFVADKYREKGAVIRYIEVSKAYQMELNAGEKEVEMVNACEELSGIEIARMYFEPGKKPQKDYHKYDPYMNKDFWDDCNLYGLSNIHIKDGLLYPGFEAALVNTVLQYSQITEYVHHTTSRTINAFNYLERFRATPQIEMLIKLKLFRVVDKLVNYEYGIIKDVDANRIDTFLGIQKNRVKMLMNAEGDIDLLRILQIEKRNELHLQEQEIQQLAEIKADYSVVGVSLEYMTVQKALNLIAKYAKCEYGTGCSRASQQLRSTASLYFDYLSMRKRLGYDLHNSVYLRPRNLLAAHDKMVSEENKKAVDERLKLVMECYPLIEKNYRKLRKKYFYEDEKYLIRPARSAKEIVQEGRTLHHCVGGDNYLTKHNKGETYILMLRIKGREDIPYITVEIKETEILQWYGNHDKKPDKETMKRWLNKYCTRLKCTSQEEKIVINNPVAIAVG